MNQPITARQSWDYESTGFSIWDWNGILFLLNWLHGLVDAVWHANKLLWHKKTPWYSLASSTLSAVDAPNRLHLFRSTTDHNLPRKLHNCVICVISNTKVLKDRASAVLKKAVQTSDLKAQKTHFKRVFFWPEKLAACSQKWQLGNRPAISVDVRSLKQRWTSGCVSYRGGMVRWDAVKCQGFSWWKLSGQCLQK